MESQRDTALRDRAIMMKLLDTGVRASELTALKLRDYEPKRGQMIIHHGKEDGKRVVFLDTAAKRLWKYLASRPGAKQDDPLFMTCTGQPLHRTALRLMIEWECLMPGCIVSATPSPSISCVTAATVRAFVH